MRDNVRAVPRPRTRTARTSALLLIAAIATAACTEDAKPERSATTPESSPTSFEALPGVPQFDPETQRVTHTDPAFSVTSGTESSQACLDERSADLATYDYGWASEAEVTVTGIELVDAKGVELVGEPLTVPPVNLGGTVAAGGEITWAEHARHLSRLRFVSWSQREDAELKTYSPGETGVFVLHLRYQPGRGSSHGLRVTYTVRDLGQDLGPYTAEVRNDLQWQVVLPGQRCTL